MKILGPVNLNGYIFCLDRLASNLRTELNKVKASSSVKPQILKEPITIALDKNPGYIQFDLIKVGRVNFNPKEHVQLKTSCNDNPLNQNQLACGYYTYNGKTELDSIGRCCRCSDADVFFFGLPWLRNGLHCGWFQKYKASEHCLRMSNLFLNVYSFRPPRVVFNITVYIYSLKDGQWNRIGLADIGPHKVTQFLKDGQIRVDFSGDFAPKLHFYRLHTKYLLVPDPSIIPASVAEINFVKSGKKEWLVVEKSKVDLFGESCNKIGVWFNAFKSQDDFCRQHQQSCLSSQPEAFWNEQTYLRYLKKPFRGLLSYYGHIIGNNDNDLSIKFRNPGIGKSQVIVTLAADSIEFVSFKTEGRIMSAYVDNFEALSTHGIIKITILNSGNFTAMFHVGVYKCSPGIESPPGRIETVNPSQTMHISMKIYAHHPLHKAHKCLVYLRDRNGKFLNELPIIFETYSTCFCPIHCDCKCTNSSSTPGIMDNLKIPENEAYAKYATDFCFVESEASKINHTSENDLNGFDLGNIVDAIAKLQELVYNTFHVTFDWIITILPFVIVISILIIAAIVCFSIRIKMLFSGNLSMPEVAIINNITKMCCKCISQNFFVLYNKSSVKSGDIGKKGWKSSIGYSIPSYCNGLCEGCEIARKNYRKKLLKHIKEDLTMKTSWWDLPHKCTCRVEKRRDIISIIVGLFYFFYCPFLPIINCGIHLYNALFRNKNISKLPKKSRNGSKRLTKGGTIKKNKIKSDKNRKKSSKEKSQQPPVHKTDNDIGNETNPPEYDSIMAI